MSNVISSLGAGSGIDTTSLVQGLVNAEKAPEEARLTSKKTSLESQISSYGLLKSALTTFQDLVSPLANSDVFKARSVSFPDTNLVVPNSIESGAQTGTYQVSVEAVAQSQTLTTSAFSDKTLALSASGTLTLEFGAWSYDGSNDPLSFVGNEELSTIDIAIVASDTLETIAGKINQSGASVQASVLAIDGQYQLMITAESGESSAVRITADNVSLDGFLFNETSHNLTERQVGKDALIFLNGISVSRSTNELSDVIPGFDFTLSQASPGEKLTFTIEEDAASAKQAVQDFVDGYNGLQSTLTSLVGYSRDSETNALVRGDLATDGSARSLVNQIKSIISRTVPGLSDGYTALTNIGIRTKLDGTLSVDQQTFDSAFNDNFDKISRLFATGIDSSNPFVTPKLGSYSSMATPGEYAVEVSSDPSRGYLNLNSITNASFDGVSDTLSPAIDTTSGDYYFQISLNGAASGTITLDGVFTSIEELRTGLQAAINSDSKLSASNAKLDVAYDSDNDRFVFTSRVAGDTSTVSILSASVQAETLGLSTALVGTDGSDVQGTIDGVAGFGTGSVLLPSLDSKLYGLNFTIAEGASSVSNSSISFSRGFAGEMSALINRFLADAGVIDSREESLSDQVDDIEVELEDLDTRMERYEARLSAQFLAMEQIISSLNSTSSSLDGLINRLPFTAQRD